MSSASGDPNNISVENVDESFHSFDKGAGDGDQEISEINASQMTFAEQLANQMAEF